MASLWEAIRELLARIFGGSEMSRKLYLFKKMEAELLTAKRDNTDSLDRLKEEIRTLEARGLRKKRELGTVTGDSKRIVVGEIERLFRELDRLQGREGIIDGNLDRIGLALAKVGEAIAALKAGAVGEQFDDIALELQDLFGQLKESDRAARDLERERYVAPERSPVDVERRVAEVEGAKISPAALSPETERRLRQLEAEEN